MTTYYVIVDERSGSQECNERVYKHIRELRNRVAELEAERKSTVAIPREVVERLAVAEKMQYTPFDMGAIERGVLRAALKALEGEG